MGTWTHIRTEKELGTYLSKTFQSFVHGPELDGEGCELHQVEALIREDLSPLTIRNNSGLWHEDDFPPDPEERKLLIAKQIEFDKEWNDIDALLDLSKKLLNHTHSGFLEKNQLSHKQDWWHGYFDSNGGGSESFLDDLKQIVYFLEERKSLGDKKAAFYVA